MVFGFIPSCGRCESCSTGHQSLCDLGAALGLGRQLDGTSRHHASNGEDLGLMCMLGTFAERTVVNEASCIKIDDDAPLDRACLLGCGVVTGWGSSVYAAEVGPNDVVAVVGIGGIGASALQGARLAGAKQIWAIDPDESKRERAKHFGATHTAASIDEAMPAITESTRGRMANKVMMTMGVGNGALLASALAITAKRGRVVVTNIHPALETTANISLLDLTLMEKQVVGSLFGSANPRADIPRVLDLYRNGQIDLDGMVTNTYALEGVNQGYADMLSGKNIRGVILVLTNRWVKIGPYGHVFTHRFACQQLTSRGGVTPNGSCWGVPSGSEVAVVSPDADAVLAAASVSTLGDRAGRRGRAGVGACHIGGTDNRCSERPSWWWHRVALPSSCRRRPARACRRARSGPEQRQYRLHVLAVDRGDQHRRAVDVPARRLDLIGDDRVGVDVVHHAGELHHLGRREVAVGDHVRASRRGSGRGRRAG